MERDLGLTDEQAAQAMQRAKAAMKRMEIHFIAPCDLPIGRRESPANKSAAPIFGAIKTGYRQNTAQRKNR